ncbi:nuclear transport factor 2 family protein [Streptomyces sp. NPDC015414]|uniref:nuclear transport factor 2 family protein n=1 Tax=unclassified Streptomyces TaxID=2593676 RepID=UPI0036FA2ED9
MTQQQTLAPASGATTAVDRWIDALKDGWRARDADAVAALFTDDAVYHQGPYGAPHTGREAVAAHWRTTLSRQKDARMWFGEPVVSGGRAAVEWWCVLYDPETGAPRNAAGCLVLRFAADGRCASFHEYWHGAPDQELEPAEGWLR